MMAHCCLSPSFRLVHLDVEDCSEELLRQQSYAIKNQLGHPRPLLGALELLAKQFLGTVLDIEVDQSDSDIDDIKTQFEKNKIPYYVLCTTFLPFPCVFMALGCTERIYCIFYIHRCPVTNAI